MQTESKTLARVYAVVASVAFAAGLMFVKLCTKTDIKAIIILRGICNVVMVLIQSHMSGIPLFSDWQTVAALNIRGIFFIMAVGGSFAATRFLKLAVFGVFTRLEGITLLIAGVIFMKNRFDWRILIAILISIIGVLLVIAPSIFGFKSSKEEDLSLEWNYNDVIGVIIGFIWLAGDTGQIVMVAQILVGNVSTTASMFFQNIAMIWFAAIWTVCTEETQNYYIDEVPYYICMCGCFYLAIYTLGESLRVEKNLGLQTILESPYAIALFLFEALIFKSSISAANWVGGFLVTACAAWSVLLAHENEEAEHKFENLVLEKEKK